MKAQEKTLIEFLRGKHQFVIPIYQRTYSWELKQCIKLWEDIEKIANNETIKHYFIGSIVRIENHLDTNEISQQIIIDGQQRITTILLLISALVLTFENKDRSKELKEDYLINQYETSELKYKMLLTQQDRSSLINIIENHSNIELDSKRIKENFEFFKEKIANINPEKIYSGIRKLTIIDITLDSEHDNPQLIFESLNSTGLELSQADLIRNYLLMGLEPTHQENLYNNYWRVMELNFGQENYTYFFNRFIRDYLTMKTGIIPNIDNVYETFKTYFINKGGVNNIDDVIKEIYKYSKYFVNMIFKREENIKLREAFSDLNDLKVDVIYPFLLNIYNDFDDKIISEDIFFEILNFVQSYVFRRFICGIPTNSLNKTFATLYKSIDKENYLNSLKSAFIFMDSYRRFPKDIEFIKELKEKDLYNTKNRNFWLRRFENYDRKERVQIEDYTIEHIMPQNINISNEWKEMLGENWKEIHENFLHTIGNLTLTGYNSELSNKPFLEKKNMKGGFNSSPLKLNNSLQGVSIWNKEAIEERADILTKTMIEIWPYPKVPNDILEKYKPIIENKEEKIYTIDNHTFLTDGSMKNLFEILRKRILNIDSSVKEIFLKNYVAYKASTNFVDIIPFKNKFRLFLNIDYKKIYDSKNLCKDYTNKGHWGNGNTEIEISSVEQIDYIIDLIKQSFENNL